MSKDADAARQQAEARAAISASLNSVGSSYDKDLQWRATALEGSGTSIPKQELELGKQTRALAKDTKDLSKLADTTNKQLRQFGDVQNFAEMIERDLLVLEETLRMADGEPESDNISGTPSRGN